MREYDDYGKIMTKNENTHWVYVLKCDINKMIYIGETKCLTTRLKAHVLGVGANVTSYMKEIEMIALYRVKDNMKYQNFQSYHELENYITVLYKDVYKEYSVYGGARTCIYKDYIYPDDITWYRPACYCELPCEIYRSYDNSWFGCPIKRIEYMEEYIPEEIPLFYEPCRIYKPIQKTALHYINTCYMCSEEIEDSEEICVNCKIDVWENYKLKRENKECLI
jgi:hypothetical protein